MCKTAIITGAGRGLGLELTKRALLSGYHAIAITRHITPALSTLAEEPGSVTVLEADVTNPAHIERCRNFVEERFKSAEILINNAGVWLDVQRRELEDPDFDIDLCYREFDVNAMGTLRVTKAFLPLLRKSSAPVRALVNLSSDCGSYGPENARTGEYGYCMSKACVNMISNLINNALKDTDIKVFSVHPGWMQTEMGFAAPVAARPDVPPEDTAECIFRLIESAPKRDHVFCDRYGNRMD